MKLNKRISQLRKGLRQNQEDMAKRLGITRGHYNKIETGKKSPSMDLLEKIAEATDTNLTVLLEDKPSAAYIAARRSPTNSLFMAQAAEYAIIRGESTKKKFNLEDAVKKNNEKLEKKKPKNK